MNLRYVRISIFELITSLILFFLLKLIMSFVKRYNIESIVIIPISTCIFMLMILFITRALYNLFKVLIYRKKYYINDIYYANWKYSKNKWRAFVKNNYKINSAIEVKILLKKSINTLILINVVAIGIVIQRNIDIHIRIIFISFLYFAFIILYLLPKILKILIYLMDNLIFTNYTVILLKSYIIINDEIFIFNRKGEKGIVKKGIYNGNIEVHYSTEWNYSKAIGFTSLRKNNIKRLVIPIPKGEYENAKKYINSPF